MTEDNISKEDDKKMQTLLASFRTIGMPLLKSLVEVSSLSENDDDNIVQVKDFNSLIDSTVLLSQEIAKEAGADEENLDANVRWALAGSASKIVAANYQATGEHITQDEIKQLAEIASSLQEKFKDHIPSGGETLPNTLATFRSKMMEAMVPVIGAVAQYSYSRSEHELLAEISEKLVKISDQVTRSLAPSGATPEQWRMLCWNILKAAGTIYTECHYAEADRLQMMEAEERAKYFAQHGNEVPMIQVWQAFNQRMAMLATLSTYLDVPASAKLDEQEW